jgi:hypothetical protein
MLGYGLDDWVYTPAEAGLLSYPLIPNRSWEKISRRHDENSPPLSAEVKFAWNYNPTSQYVSLIWFSVKLRER